jgi:hypothetical protein
VTERGRVMAATAMEVAMKASDGDEGDGEGDSSGGRAAVTSVEGKEQWRGRQERLRLHKEGDAKAARAMATVTRVAGDKEDEGIEEGNE